VPSARQNPPVFAPGRVGEAGRVHTAFVLGGGGILGAHEVGMLRALSEAGIRPDVVVGTSVGAINGALVAADPAWAAARLAGLWQGDELQQAFSENVFISPQRAGEKIYTDQIRRLAAGLGRDGALVIFPKAATGPRAGGGAASGFWNGRAGRTWPPTPGTCRTRCRPAPAAPWPRSPRVPAPT
jgi:Patatin-like phospholipase